MGEGKGTHGRPSSPKLEPIEVLGFSVGGSGRLSMRISPHALHEKQISHCHGLGYPEILPEAERIEKTLSSVLDCRESVEPCWWM